MTGRQHNTGHSHSGPVLSVWNFHAPLSWVWFNASPTMKSPPTGTLPGLNQAGLVHTITPSFSVSVSLCASAPLSLYLSLFLSVCTTQEDQFTPSTRWVPGLEYSCLRLRASAFNHWVISAALYHFSNILHTHVFLLYQIGRTMWMGTVSSMTSNG